MSRLKRFLPVEILKTIYNALVQPHLNYGILLWGKNIRRICKLQKWAVRSITCSKYNAHTDPLFIKLKILKVDDIYKLNLLKFAFKYNHKLLPNYFYGKFDPTYANHDHDTRQSGQPVVAIPRTSSAENSIRYSLPNLMIKTNPAITEKITTHSFTGFSNYAKQYFISQYNSTCTIENCYICNQN